VPLQRNAKAMSATAIPRPFAAQHAFNRQVWARLVNDPTLSDVLEKLETDRDGNLLMSPPPKKPHLLRQDRINQLLKQHLPEGGSLVEDTVSTPQGVKRPDVAWYSAPNAAALENEPDEVLSTVRPDLCVEILSPGNTAREIRDKTAAYFAAGVREVWICDRDGKMSFFAPQGPLGCSAICPDFPREIPATFLRRPV
jgi:Uma2 family endonuclease